MDPVILREISRTESRIKEQRILCDTTARILEQSPKGTALHRQASATYKRQLSALISSQECLNDLLKIQSVEASPQVDIESLAPPVELASPAPAADAVRSRKVRG